MGKCLDCNNSVYSYVPLCNKCENIMTSIKFKQIRKDAGYTQSQLSDLIGIDSRTIRRYEAGMAIHKPVVILMELIEQGIYPIDHKRKVG